jgi:hypothetical protein
MSAVNSVEEFERTYQGLSDACDNGIIDVDTYDLIGSVMSEIYVEEARNLAIKAREIEPGDSHVPDANLADLFQIVTNKEQFISDFRNAITLAQRDRYSTDLPRQVIALR